MLSQVRAMRTVPLLAACLVAASCAENADSSPTAGGALDASVVSPNWDVLADALAASPGSSEAMGEPDATTRDDERLARVDADAVEYDEESPAPVDAMLVEDGRDASPESSPPPSECVDARLTPDADAHALEARMQALVDGSPDCHDTSEGECQMRTATIENARPWCQSRGQRILVIDDLDFTCAPFERVLAYYQLDVDNRFVEATPTVSMQAGVFSILHDMIGRSTYFRSLLQLPTALDQKFSVPFCKAHGANIAASIARVAPLAQFVLADLSTGAGQELSCDIATIEQRLRTNMASVQSMIEAYGVGYVNFSGSLTLAKLGEAFQHCSPSEEWLHRVFGVYLREWYRPLGTAPGVVLVQAAPNAGDATRGLQADDPDFLVDCTALPNRLRVACGSHDDLETGWDAVPPEGLSWNQYSDALAPELRDLRACVDVYYNSHTMCASSYAAPRALAHLLYLQGVRGAAGEMPLDPPALVAAATHGDPPRLIDPVGNRQFEVDRMFPDLR